VYAVVHDCCVCGGKREEEGGKKEERDGKNRKERNRKPEIILIRNIMRISKRKYKKLV
jgi:hypothetical protein